MSTHSDSSESELEKFELKLEGPLILAVYPDPAAPGTYVGMCVNFEVELKDLPDVETARARLTVSLGACLDESSPEDLRDVTEDVDDLDNWVRAFEEEYPHRLKSEGPQTISTSEGNSYTISVCWLVAENIDAMLVVIYTRVENSEEYEAECPGLNLWFTDGDLVDLHETMASAITGALLTQVNGSGTLSWDKARSRARYQSFIADQGENDWTWHLLPLEIIEDQVVRAQVKILECFDVGAEPTEDEEPAVTN